MTVLFSTQTCQHWSLEASDELLAGRGRNRAMAALIIYWGRGRLYFSKCPWLLKLLFYGAIIAKVLLWEPRIAIIKQVYICFWRKTFYNSACQFCTWSPAYLSFPLQWSFSTELVFRLYVNDKRVSVIAAQSYTNEVVTHTCGCHLPAACPLSQSPEFAVGVWSFPSVISSSGWIWSTKTSCLKEKQVKFLYSGLMGDSLRTHLTMEFSLEMPHRKSYSQWGFLQE